MTPVDCDRERDASDREITPAMIRAGVMALLDSFSEEYLSESTPGLEIAVGDVFRAMLTACRQSPSPIELKSRCELSLASLIAPSRWVSFLPAARENRCPKDEVEQ